MGDMIQIVPRSNLYVAAYGYGDDQRFAKVFRDTWLQIPIWARRIMLRHWRTDDTRTFFGIIHPRETRKGRRALARGADSYLAPPNAFIPRIELLSKWPKFRGELACVQGRGHIIRFNAAVFAKMSDSVATDVIAHELAHVYQFAVGFEKIFGTDAPGNGDLELDADEMVGEWGFEVESINKWSVEQGRSKLVVCKSLEECVELRFGKGSRYSNEK